MNLKDFKAKIRRGLGSAIIALKSDDDISKYRDIVLWACLNVTSYDAQIEGSRGIYLYDAICCFEDKKFFENKVINKFIERNTYYLNDQLIDILYRFAHSGSKIAIKALYDKFDYYIDYLLKNGKFRNRNDDLPSLENLMITLCKLHGFMAYKKITIEIGKVIVIKNIADIFDYDWFYRYIKDKFGEKRLMAYLGKQSKNSRYLKAFKVVYDTLKENDEQWSDKIENPSAVIISIDDILNLPENHRYYKSKINYLARGVSKTLTDESKIELAYSIVNETNLKTKSLFLNVFKYIKFPLSIDLLFEYAANDNEMLQESAYSALAIYKNKKVYDLAVTLLSQNKSINIAFKMLENNYHKDDALIYSVVKKCKNNIMDFHYIGMDIRSLYEKNKSKHCYETLKYLYDKGHCSFCRSYFIETMHKNKLFPDTLLNECLYDSNEDIRKFAKRILVRRLRNPNATLPLFSVPDK